MAEQPQRTRDEVKVLLERGAIADLERLIANPGRKNRAEFASSYAISALKNSADLSCYPMIFGAWCYRYLNCMKRQVIHS
jgi:hypothetical protein